MNLNDLNHASLTSCDQDASSKLLCRYRLIRAARNYHHGGIVTTEPDRPRARPLRLAGWLLAQASACPPSESFDFGGSHGANAPLRVACGWSGPEGPPALRCATERAIVRSACARLRSDEPRHKLNWIQFKLIWNCVVKVP